jgi:hypothetical protein
MIETDIKREREREREIDRGSERKIKIDKQVTSPEASRRIRPPAKQWVPFCVMLGVVILATPYMDAPLTRKRNPPGPHCRPMPRVLGGS